LTAVASGDPPGVAISLVPRRGTVRPGGTVVVDAFAMGSANLRSYQIKLAIEGSPDPGLGVESAWIDVDRNEFVFESEPMVHAADAAGGRVGAALMRGDVALDGRVYLGSFTLRASKHASGTYRIRAALTEGASSMHSSIAMPYPLVTPESLINVVPRTASQRAED